MVVDLVSINTDQTTQEVHDVRPHNFMHVLYGLMNVLRFTAMLAEQSSNNQTLIDYAAYTASFYEHVLVPFSPRPGCLQQQISIGENGDAQCGTNSTATSSFLDCSNWFAGGLSALSYIAANQTYEESYVAWSPRGSHSHPSEPG